MIARLLLILFLSTPALAVTSPGEMLPDPAQEARARALSRELRCLVCQNQSIDDSDAPLAKDLRVIVRERLQAGDSDGQIRDFIVQRYGEFVLLKPAFGLHTALLWLGPVLVLAAGLAGLFLALRAPRNASPAPLSNEERASLEALLKRDHPAS